MIRAAFFVELLVEGAIQATSLSSSGLNALLALVAHGVTNSNSKEEAIVEGNTKRKVDKGDESTDE